MKTRQVQSCILLQCLHLHALLALAYLRAEHAHDLGREFVLSFCARDFVPFGEVSSELSRSAGSWVHAGKKGKEKAER